MTSLPLCVICRAGFSGSAFFLIVLPLREVIVRSPEVAVSMTSPDGDGSVTLAMALSSLASPSTQTLRKLPMRTVTAVTEVKRRMSP